VIRNHRYWNKMRLQVAGRECISSLIFIWVLHLCFSFVCAKNAHNMNIPMLFRSYKSHETHPECKIWEAARATSAAPTFFKRIEIGRAQPFIDGGVGRNNPSWVVLDEANTLFGAHPIRVPGEHRHWAGRGSRHQETWVLPADGTDRCCRCAASDRN